MCSVALKFYDQRDKDCLLKKKKSQVALINEKHRFEFIKNLYL